MMDSLRAIEASTAQIAALLPWILGLLAILVALKLYDLFAPLGELPSWLDSVQVKLIRKAKPNDENSQT